MENEPKIRVRYEGNSLKVYNSGKEILSLSWEEAVIFYLNVKHEVEKKLFIYARKFLPDGVNNQDENKNR